MSFLIPPDPYAGVKRRNAWIAVIGFVLVAILLTAPIWGA